MDCQEGCDRMSTRIYKDNDEIRFEVTDDIYVYTHKYSKKVVTIQQALKGDYEEAEIDMWTKDIDALIDALLDLKQEIGKLP